MKLGRKVSGGKYHARRKRRSHEIIGQELKVTIGETRIKTLKVKGGNKKQRALRVEFANLSIGKKVEKVEIKNVLETPQNMFFARQNILFKGSIVETSKGKAKITNRPTQEGFVNATLITQ